MNRVRGVADLGGRVDVLLRVHLLGLEDDAEHVPLLARLEERDALLERRAELLAYGTAVVVEDA